MCVRVCVSDSMRGSMQVGFISILRCDLAVVFLMRLESSTELVSWAPGLMCDRVAG